MIGPLLTAYNARCYHTKSAQYIIGRLLIADTLSDQGHDGRIEYMAFWALKCSLQAKGDDIISKHRVTMLADGGQTAKNTRKEIPPFTANPHPA